MSVTDRWHKSRPAPGEPKCAEHKNLVPSRDHGQGDRWQVRWRDEEGRQKKRNFARKSGKDPEAHADAFDAKIRAELDSGSYADPSGGSAIFREYAEEWRRTRTHDMVTAERVEREFRIHVYPVIGDRAMRELGKRPSLTQAWIAGMKLSAGSALTVIRDVSSVYVAALDDGIIARNPLAARSVSRPSPEERKARPWTLEQVRAMSAELPARYAVIPWLGAGTGMRQGELLGLAVEDIDFLRRVIHVRRQVRVAGGKLCYSTIKNEKAHDVPLAGSLARLLAEHIRRYPPAAVTLPWKVPGGEPQTHRLLITTPAGNAMHRVRAGEMWRAALGTSGIVPPRKPGEKRWPPPGDGMHALRHTAASAWLAERVGIPAVAAWLGDTEQTVWDVYAHMVPGDPDSGRKAMDSFLDPSSARSVPSAGEN